MLNAALRRSLTRGRPQKQLLQAFGALANNNARGLHSQSRVQSARGFASRGLMTSFPFPGQSDGREQRYRSGHGKRCASTSTSSTASVDPSALSPTALATAPLEAADGTLLEPLGMYPQDLLLKLMSFCHDATGISWAAVIVVATLALRTALVPLTIYTTRTTSKMGALKPQLDAIMAKYESQPNADPAMRAKEIRDLYARNKVNPLAMAVPFVQFPFFMSFFFATKKLGDYFPEASTEGLWWFTDLSAPDPLHIMPVVASLGFILTIKVGADGAPKPEGNMKMMQPVMYGLGALTIPIAWAFPAATVFYWCINNTFSLTQTAILNFPGVKPALGILPPPPKTPTGAPGVGVTPTSFASMPVRKTNEDGSIEELPDIRPDDPVTHNPKATRRKRSRRQRKKGQDQE